MSLGAPKSERGRSQSQGLLFRGDRQGVRQSRSADPQDGGGAETRQGRKAEAEARRAAGRGQAGAQAVKRSSARENTGRQGKNRIPMEIVRSF